MRLLAVGYTAALLLLCAMPGLPGSLLAPRWPAAQHNTERWIEGTVASLPEHSGGDAATADWRFLFEASGGDVPSRIRVAWFRSNQVVRGGDCWRLQLRLRTPHGSLNPGGFDYEGWLFRQGVAATASVRAAQPCAARPGYTMLRWRQQLVDEIRAALAGRPSLGLVLALTVGDRSAFNDRDWDVFRATGTTHLVAISGFNIAIVSGFAFFLFRWLWCAWPRLCLWLPAQRAGLLGAALLAGLYACIAGLDAPVARAVLMCWLVLAAAWMNRLTDPSRVLALAWLLILLLDPWAVLSPGLWLSFAAVGAIFYVSLNRLQPQGWWHGAVSLQLILAVALAPISLYFFQGASWVAPLVNLVAVPLFALLTPWVLAAVVVLLPWPAAGQPLLDSAAWALELVRLGLETAAQSPGLWLPANPPPTALALALFGVVVLFAPRGLPLRPLALLCMAPLLLVQPAPPRGGFELTVLDVGQGLAVVARTEHHVLLYDAGPAFEDGFDAGASVVAPFILGQGLRQLDLLFLSHGDNDHAGGVAAVRKLLDVKGEVGTVESVPCQQGMNWTWDGVRFEVLHPDAGAYSENNASCVLKVSGPFSVLLPGDVEAAAESRLVRDFGATLASDVLVAPHHGSKTSSTEEFVRAVRPQVVAYGAGWRHHFGHPRREVAARYRELGARQFTTGTSGALRIWRESGELRIEEYRKQAAKFWNAPPESIP